MCTVSLGLSVLTALDRARGTRRQEGGFFFFFFSGGLLFGDILFWRGLFENPVFVCCFARGFHTQRPGMKTR
jgi:hypothetical protein